MEFFKTELETRTNGRISVENYFGGISSPNTAFRAGSRLSAHLAWGTISARTVHTALQRRLEELRSTVRTGVLRRISTKLLRNLLEVLKDMVAMRTHFLRP